MTAISLSYRVRSQGHSPPTAGAELGLTVRTQAPAAVCKLGLVADAAGGRVVPVNGRASRHRGLPDNRLPVAGQLLLDSSGRDKAGQKHECSERFHNLSRRSITAAATDHPTPFL